MPTPTSLQVTKIVVSQRLGNRLQVLTSATGQVDQGPDAVGVIANAPLTLTNGGPQKGNYPVGNIYDITCTYGGQPHQILQVRYLGLTPDGNAQFTTE